MHDRLRFRVTVKVKVRASRSFFICMIGLSTDVPSQSSGLPNSTRFSKLRVTVGSGQG